MVLRTISIEKVTYISIITRIYLVSPVITEIDPVLPVIIGIGD
jgi:hypothetical protein